MLYFLLNSSATDTTKIEIISKQIDKIVASLSKTSTGLTSGEMALIAAAIGASAAIVAQLVVFFLTRFKERKNLKIELIAQERQTAYLLSEYYKDLVMHKVHKQYWYRTSSIYNPGTEDSRDSHQRHFLSNQRSFEVKTKINVTTSEYFKIVSHYINLTKPNIVITQELTNLKTFKPRKASEFSEISEYVELVRAESIEEEELSKVYLFYSECFDRINTEMAKNL